MPCATGYIDSTPPRMITFGDSITVGVGASITANRWSSKLASSLGYTEINKGISGSVLQNTGSFGGNGQDRYMNDVYNQKPWKYVFILYGLNDAIQGGSFTNSSFDTSYRAIITDLLQTFRRVAPTNIVLGSVPYVNPLCYVPLPQLSTLKLQQYRDIIALVASDNGCKYADIYQDMVDNGGNSLIDVDNIHPNDAVLEVGHDYLYILYIRMYMVYDYFILFFNTIS